MQLDLDARVAELIQRQVDTGRYSNASEVVNDAMRLLEELEKRRSALHAALAIGHEQIARGEYVEWTPGSMDRLLQEADERYRQGQQPHPDVWP